MPTPNTLRSAVLSAVCKHIQAANSPPEPSVIYSTEKILQELELGSLVLNPQITNEEKRLFVAKSDLVTEAITLGRSMRLIHTKPVTKYIDNIPVSTQELSVSVLGRLFSKTPKIGQSLSVALFRITSHVIAVLARNKWVFTLVSTATAVIGWLRKYDVLPTLALAAVLVGAAVSLAIDWLRGKTEHAADGSTRT